jgi:hypothetical protein
MEHSAISRWINLKAAENIVPIMCDSEPSVPEQGLMIESGGYSSSPEGAPEARGPVMAMAISSRAFFCSGR